MMQQYTPSAWYWFVANDQSRAWSSAVAAYVPASDVGLQAWIAGGNSPSRIESEAALAAVLAPYGLTPPNVADQSALDAVALNAALAAPGSVFRANAIVTFNEINKLRVLAGQAAYTLPQYVAALKAQMR